jgi:hypothetical protein
MPRRVKPTAIVVYEDGKDIPPFIKAALLTVRAITKEPIRELTTYIN